MRLWSFTVTPNSRKVGSARGAGRCGDLSMARAWQLGIFPGEGGGGVRRFEADLRWIREEMALSLVLEADPALLCLPEVTAVRRADGLWRSTCFEAFVAVEGEDAYREFNFAPSGEWAAYAFAGYRQARVDIAAADGSAPPAAWRRGERDLRLEVRLGSSWLPAVRGGAHLEIGVSAVIEMRSGIVTHWALRHPREVPDFHDRRAFAARLPLQEQGA